MALGVDYDNAYTDYKFEYLQTAPYGQDVAAVGALVSSARLLVGFNIKFDLHWLRRYGIDFSHCTVWDCQLAHYILSRQRHTDPSLADTARHHNLGGKLDVVRVEYWENGIDTDGVPWDTLAEYLRQDVNLTKQIWQRQEDYLLSNPRLRRSIWLSCQDLLVTEEMEANGLPFNFEKMERDAADLRRRIDALGKQLQEYCDAPINWDSGQHLSAFLYGGVAKIKEKEKYVFEYKDGRRAEKERWTVREYHLPRMVEPIEGTSLSAIGYFETNEAVLRSLPRKGKVGKIIDLILERAGLEKRLGTYYEGLPKIYNEYQWSDNIIHGSLNHCRTGTGRLASARPNQQNMDKKVLECLVTRF